MKPSRGYRLKVLLASAAAAALGAVQAALLIAIASVFFGALWLGHKAVACLRWVDLWAVYRGDRDAQAKDRWHDS